jgi:predicted RNA-binding protein YlqC (UPF0109 family)
MGAAEDLTAVLRGLVSQPEAVRVEVAEGERGPRLDVHVDPADLGAVIGRRGRTVNALRTLLRLRGQGAGEFHDLKVVEGD